MSALPRLLRAWHCADRCLVLCSLVPKKKWGSDDNAYRLYPEMHRLVPRAYSILVVKGPSREVECPMPRAPRDVCALVLMRVPPPQLVGRTVVQGFYKFSSRSSVDEDSSVAVTHLLAPEKLDGADRCVVTEKANGKAAVVTMVTVNGQVCLVGGSKVRSAPAASTVCMCVTRSSLCFVVCAAGSPSDRASERDRPRVHCLR